MENARRQRGGSCRQRKAPTLKNKKRSMLGLLHPGEGKKFSMTGVRDMGWEDPGDDIVGEVSGSQIVENHIVCCHVSNEEPLKAPRGQSHNPVHHLGRSFQAVVWSCPPPSDRKARILTSGFPKTLFQAVRSAFFGGLNCRNKIKSLNYLTLTVF